MAIALAAVIIGAAVFSGMTSVYYDMDAKMKKELRVYGANLVFEPKLSGGGKYIPLQEVELAAATFAEKGLVGVAPFLYGVVNIDDQRVIAVGSWYDQVQKVSPYWQVEGQWIAGRQDTGSILLGVAVAEKLRLKIGDNVTLTSEDTGEQKRFVVKGVVHTGSTEDNQVFISLPAAHSLLGNQGLVNVAYLSVIGDSSVLEKEAVQIGERFSSLDARPIKRISQSEGQILAKISALVYLVVAVILLSTLICVATTMMTMVIERRREIGLKKALGADNRDIVIEFLGEGVLMGLAGGTIGWAMGLLFAQLVGQSVFQSAVSIRAIVIPLVLITSVAVSGIASILPVRMAVGVEPAVVLKGE